MDFKGVPAPIDFDIMKQRIEHLLDFVQHAEQELFDKEKFDKRSLDVQAILYDKAKKSLNDDLDMVRKFISSKFDLDPASTNTMRNLMVLNGDQKKVISKVITMLLKHDTSDLLDVLDDADNKL
jgi:hypothetical protein